MEINKKINIRFFILYMHIQMYIYICREYIEKNIYMYWLSESELFNYQRIKMIIRLVNQAVTKGYRIFIINTNTRPTRCYIMEAIKM